MSLSAGARGYPPLLATLMPVWLLQEVWRSGHIFYTRARLVSAYEVQCLMPFSVLDFDIRWSQILWLVSVSNDRVTWSEETQVFVYDSKCLECDDESGNSTCAVKVSCFCVGLRFILFFVILFCRLAVLNPRVGHTMDVLSPLIPVLCHSDWLFHGESGPPPEVVNPGRGDMADWEGVLHAS